MNERLCKAPGCDRKHHARGYCWRHYIRVWGGYPLESKTLAERFWVKVDKNGPTPERYPELGPCWIWTAALVGGYGVVRFKGRSVHAQRISWELTNGPIHKGLWVLHHCDNPPCVNPSHLFLGTQKENMADCLAKGRKSQGDSHRAVMREKAARGENHGKAKLNVEVVRQIRKRYAAGGISYRELAIQYGVKAAQIGLIVRRVNWKEVDEETGEGEYSLTIRRGV